MKKLFLTLVLLSIGYVGSIAFGAIATLNGAISINTSTLNASTIANYWQMCLDQTDEDPEDNLQKAMYVGQNIDPKFRYGYRNTNASKAKAILDSTNMLVYNPSTFSSNGQFSFLSNINPNLNSPNSFSIVVTKLNTTVTATNNIVGRSSVAGMYILRGVYQTFTFGGSTSANTYGYRTSYTQTTPTYFNKNLSNGATPAELYSCVRYYVAKCGDGVKDNSNKPGNTLTDGKYGILVDGEIVTWGSASPTEQCDGTDGVPAGYTCTSSCTLQQVVTPLPSCTLTINTGSILLGGSAQVTWAISGNYTNTPQLTYTPTAWGMNGLPYTVTSANGSRTIIPQHTGVYNISMMVSNSAGQKYCNVQIGVHAPQQLQCTLTLNPTTVYVNQPTSVGWNVTGGNFFGTYIYVAPQVLGAWPHQINANQYNGNTIMIPTQAGNYLFTMMVNNPNSSATCTGLLTVLPLTGTAPSCILTVAPNAVAPGAQVTIGWNVFGNFLTTQITNTPLNTITGIPYTVAANTNTGSIAVSAPNVSGTYLFAMNVTNNFGTSLCTGAFTVQTTAQLQLTKTLMNNILYHSGDLVSFRIDFANIGNTTVHNAVLTDRLPAGLTYESSQLYGVNPPYMFGTGNNGNNIMVEYSGFSLVPGQTGYMIITGKFKGYQWSNQTLNNVFLDSDETDILYAAALFLVYTPNANATITKTSDKQIYYPSENVQFVIGVTNNGPDIIDNVQLTDIRPTNNTSCLTIDTAWTANTPMTMIGNNPYIWTLNAPLATGQIVYLQLTGHIANNPSCVGTYINNVNLQYTVNGLIKTGHADATIKVIPTPSSTMTIQKNVLQYGNASGDPISFELIYYNNGTATISNYDIVDYRPGTLTFTSASPMPASQTTTPGGQLLHRYFTTPLAPNGSGRIVINGIIN